MGLTWRGVRIMPKIKNWSSAGEMMWKHDENDVNLRIVQMPPGYHIKVNSHTAGQYENKMTARKKAVMWMREHPNPSHLNPTNLE